MTGKDPSRQKRATWPAWFSARARALRAFSFPLSVLPVLIATAAVRPVANWHWGILVVSALTVMLLHAMGNLLNDYFDFRSGVDRKVEGDDGRPGRLLVRGELTPREVFIEAMTCLLVGVPLAAYLIWMSGPGLLWFGLAAALALYAYTGPPFRLKYRALGEMLIFLVFGPLLTVGAAYAQTGGFEWLALVLSVPVGVVTTAVLLGNNIRDMEEDRAAGVRTLAHSMGARAARAAYALGVIVPPLAVACLAAGGVLRVNALVCLISLVPAVFLLRSVLGIRRAPDVDARTARYAALFFATLLVGVSLPW